MIEQADIVNWLKNPNLLNDENISEIKQLLDLQPYYQPYYFLLLRYYKQQNSWEFDILLKRSAIHIFDRRKLFLYLNDLEEPRAKNIEQRTKSKETGASRQEPEAQPEEQRTKNKEQRDESQESDASIQKPASKSREEPQRRDDIDTLEEALSDAIQKHVSDNQHIEEKLIIPDISFELDENLEIIRPNNSENIDFISFQNSQEEIEILNLDEKNEEEVNEEPLPQENQPDFEPEEFTTGIVLDMHEEMPDDESLFEKQHHDFSENNKETLEFTAWFDHLEQAQDEQTEPKKESTNNSNKNFDLIDKFLQEDPRIRPKPILEDEQNDISESSIEEHEDFITDTLAKIYLKQGNYLKAISAYQKLSLKFPEKNTYFASQIREIQKLINNQ